METDILNFDAQALREKILDLAMRGQLVPQDSNDEPASVLLEKIKAEKAELVKEKKIKKSKSLPAITDEEKPFDIPDSWEWVRLGDVFLETIGGGTPSKRVVKYWNGKIPWISVKDVHENSLEIKTTQDTITNEGLENSSTNLIKPNTLIAVMRMAVGRIAVNKIEACINQDLRALITSKYFYDKYLLYIYHKLNFETSGITVKGLKINALLETIIPLPPFSEQKRIANKIAQLFALLRKVESSTQQYAELQTLLKSKVLNLAMHGKLVKQDPNDEPVSVLLEKIKAEKAELVKEKKIKKSKPLPPITDEEKPFDIPDNWEWVRCQEVTTIGNFHTVSPDDIAVGENLIELADIESYSGKLINCETVVDKVGSNKYKYTQGQVLFAKLRPYLRKVLIAPNDGVCTTELLPINGIKVNNVYLYYAFLSDLFFDQIKREMHGVNLPRVSPKTLAELIIPLPPLLEQNRIISKIADLFNIV